MSLDERARGELEHLIDFNIQNVPMLVKSLFSPQTRAEWQIQNQNDFLTGYVVGIIRQGYIDFFNRVYERLPNQQELLEINDIIYRRTRDIREAIFKVG